MDEHDEVRKKLGEFGETIDLVKIKNRITFLQGEVIRGRKLTTEEARELETLRALVAGKPQP